MTMIADLKFVVAPWTDEEGLSFAHRWGKEDATEGRPYWFFPTASAAEHEAYCQGYNEGLAIVAKMAGAQSEGEFMAETLDAMWLERLDAAQMAEIEAERSALYDYEHRGVW